MYACLHVHARAYVFARFHVNLRMYVCMYIYTHARACTRMGTVRVHAHADTCMHAVRARGHERWRACAVVYQGVSGGIRGYQGMSGGGMYQGEIRG